MKKILLILLIGLSFGLQSQDTLNIYTKGNVIFVVDSINNVQYTGLTKDVVITKVYNDTTLYSFYGIRYNRVIDISYFKKEDDTAYTLNEWETFRKNL